MSSRKEIARELGHYNSKPISNAQNAMVGPNDELIKHGYNPGTISEDINPGQSPAQLPQEQPERPTDSDQSE